MEGGKQLRGEGKELYLWGGRIRKNAIRLLLEGHVVVQRRLSCNKQ